MNLPCPCGGGQHDRCCGRWSSTVPPSTPEALMRSRYTAYVRGDVAWLRATWHPSTCPVDLEIEPGLRWLGLTVHEAPPFEGDEGRVRFTARCRVGGGSAQRMTEHSRFVFEQGRWWYLEALD